MLYHINYTSWVSGSKPWRKFCILNKAMLSYILKDTTEYGYMNNSKFIHAREGDYIYYDFTHLQARTKLT